MVRRMKLNVTGMIYDRMVQNNREAAERDRKRRISASVPPVATINPAYQVVAYAAVSPPKVEVPEMPAPERLFGDPPPRRDWGWLSDIAINLGFILVMLSFMALVVIAAAAASAGKPDNNVRQDRPIEVEK